MTQKVVKRNAKTKQNDTGTFIFKLPEGVNVIQATKMSETIFVKGGVIEVDSSDTVLLNHVRGIDGASDITETIAQFRGE